VSGEVVLAQALFNNPITLIPAKNTNVIYCLYDYDAGGLVLMKIDTSKKLEAIRPHSFIKSILYSSPWFVEDARLDDWQQVYEYLNNLPPYSFKHQAVPGYNFVVLQLAYSREGLLDEMKRQIDSMVKTGATGWPIDSDSVPTNRVRPLR
jgi:hypothetical protein